MNVHIGLYTAVLGPLISQPAFGGLGPQSGVRRGPIAQRRLQGALDGGPGPASSTSGWIPRPGRPQRAGCLEFERPDDTEEQSSALFLAAATCKSPTPTQSSAGSVPHDLRHSFAYRLSAASGHNRAELERRLGHANDRYLRLYTNPPEDIAAGWAEHL